MSGGRTPGTLGILGKPICGLYSLEHCRGGAVYAISLGKDRSAKPTTNTLQGWPRSVSWDDFEDVQVPRDGFQEYAQIQAAFRQASRVESVREADGYRLNDYGGTLQIVRANTWVVSTQKTDALLRHEQGHFDIYGLVARDLIAALATLRSPTRRGLRRRMVQLFQRYSHWQGQLSSDYDTETNHGRDAEPQAEWEARIRECMQHGTSLPERPSP